MIYRKHKKIKGRLATAVVILTETVHR